MIRAKVFWCLLICVLSLILSPQYIMPQERETAIIQMTELVKLFNLLNNLELSVTKHEWNIIFSAFLDPAYADTLKIGNKWQDLEWVSKAFYPDFAPVSPAESQSRANSITTLKHFLSEVKIFKQAGCDFYIILSGIRTIEFDLGKKYIPFETGFCLKNNNWLIQIPQ